MTFHIIATLHPKPEFKEAVEMALKSLVSATRQEAGNISYDLYTSTKEETTFHLIESYVDQEAFETHRSTQHYLDYRAKAVNWLISLPTVAMLRPLDVASALEHGSNPGGTQAWPRS